MQNRPDADTGPSGPGLPQLSPQQRLLLERLNGLNHDLGVMYYGALLVWLRPDNPDHLALAAHGIRELVEKMPRFLNVAVQAQGETMKNKVFGLYDCWQQTLKVSKCYDTGSRLWDGQIDKALSRFLDRLSSFFLWIETHRPRRKTEAAQLLLRLEASGRVLPQPLKGLNAADWLRLRDYFEGTAHHRSTTREEFARRLDALERFLLERLVPRTFADFEQLDELMRQGESDGCEIVEEVLQLIRKQYANYEYFFSGLTSPEWIAPLRDKGFFQNPPDPVVDAEGLVGFPPWPESRYLQRVAGSAPRQVLDIVLSLTHTENARVREDLAQAACAMPPELASQWARKEAEWIRGQSYLYLSLPSALGELLSHLGRGNCAGEALCLARALLAILPEPEAASAGAEHSAGAFARPCARFDEWQYEQIIRDHVPHLVTAAGLAAVDLLCDLLADAVRLSGESPEDSFSDYSYIWRPEVESDEEHPHDLRDVLITAVRDAGEALMPGEGGAVLERIEARPSAVFQRIGLHLRREWPTVDPAGTAAKILDRSLFGNHQVWHEYYLLVQDRFEHLPCEQQKQYLQLVQASEDYEMLRPVSQWLTGRWRQVFDEFTADHPGPVRPDLLVQPSRVWVGPTSPKDAGELASMPLSELVEFLAAWAPAGQFMSPSPEGLGRTLSEAVASNPVRFAQEARQFIGSDPTYVRHFVSGLREAAEKGSSFSWGPVLELCQWAVEQPREQARATQELEYREPHWGWTRQEIAKLLSTGFEKRQSEMPYELRRPAWVVLEPITDDPDPTSEHEAEYGGDNMDPATMSINTVRGEAMHAVVRYALWVRRHLEGLPDSHERLGKGFDEMPEVRAVLDRHLDSNADPTLTVRSVYGKWFPWLALLDRNWARARVERIFPSLEPTSRLRDAAWDSYVSFCDAYDEVYELVQDQYKQAVHRLGETQKRPLRLRSPDEYLAQHLMALYVRGTVTLDEPDGILAQVYARANDSLRAHALSSIGGRIAKTPGLSEVAKERLHRLWQWRLDEAQIAGDVEAHREEMAAFGWWFTSGRFDETWALDQLAAVLKLAGWVEPTALVLERLAEMAAREPGRATECLDALIENDARGWAILGSHEEIRSILQTALHNQHQETRRSAEATVNKLLARGHLNFRDLLRS